MADSLATQRTGYYKCPHCGQARKKDQPHACEGSARDAARLALFGELVAALDWIQHIAAVNYEQDQTLRTDGARTLKRIADRANQVLAKAREIGRE